MRDTDTADSGFAELSGPACWALLPRSGVARLAWSDPAGRIMVVPVNYGLDGRTVILRTGDTALLEAARAGRRCAFQVDDIEPALRSGWTVLIDATVVEVDDEDVVDRLARLVDPWVRGPLPHVLLLQATGISGRSLHAVGGVEVVRAEPDD
jgi:uncharacterized protein